mmetsp:Transcript_23766/g.26229  ORF Transcript_23766/g.26229 Transcript_23766/m.26229 type:complete len:102 (+) Transcript_23766:52-357(+)
MQWRQRSVYLLPQLFVIYVQPYQKMGFLRSLLNDALSQNIPRNTVDRLTKKIQLYSLVPKKSMTASGVMLINVLIEFCIQDRPKKEIKKMARPTKKSKIPS